jgi:hypothetical protein
MIYFRSCSFWVYSKFLYFRNVIFIHISRNIGSTYNIFINSFRSSRFRNVNNTFMSCIKRSVSRKSSLHTSINSIINIYWKLFSVYRCSSLCNSLLYFFIGFKFCPIGISLLSYPNIFVKTSYRYPIKTSSSMHIYSKRTIHHIRFFFI